MHSNDLQTHVFFIPEINGVIEVAWNRTLGQGCHMGSVRAFVVSGSLVAETCACSPPRPSIEGSRLSRSKIRRGRERKGSLQLPPSSNYRGSRKTGVYGGGRKGETVSQERRRHVSLAKSVASIGNKE